MRTSGVLMPIFSLSSKYGIGTLGKAAFDFVDFLKNAGQSYWQILPTGVTGFGDSPYQSISAFAGNPYFIDLDLLIEDGYITKADVDALEWGEDYSKVDYEQMFSSKYKILRTAYKSFVKKIPSDFEKFKEENSFWLEDFALYSAIKAYHNGASFDTWEKGYLKREDQYIKKAETEFAHDIGFYKFVQYIFNKQWQSLKEYANKNGIGIIGDIPIYVALDSADVWSCPEQFQLDKDYTPKAVAGCPPDAFSDDGQLWGNPLYDWDYMQKDGFSWWIKRIKHCSKLFDVVRIDHFRAFSAYYSIPYGDENAKNGAWKKCPGKALFDTLKEKLGKLNIIAEDLGTIDDDVRALLKYTGFPGMKVLQFAFDPESESSYLPHNIDKNCVVYTGTHDNDTIVGFMKSISPTQLKFVKEYLRIDDNDSYNWAFIKAAMATCGDTVIFQMQDFLGLDNTARINTPSTNDNNWKWRIGEGCINDWLAQIIYDVTKLYYRLGKN